MAYKITLTQPEIKTLAWLADRGYDCGMYDSLANETRDESDDSVATYEIPEHKAWEIYEASECPDSGFACLDWDSPLGEKIRKFLNSIV